MIIWDDSQEKVDFRAPSPPSNLGFHAITPNLPDMPDHTALDWMPSVKSESGGGFLAMPVPTTPPKRTGGDLTWLKNDNQKDIYTENQKSTMNTL